MIIMYAVIVIFLSDMGLMFCVSANMPHACSLSNPDRADCVREKKPLETKACSYTCFLNANKELFH